MFTFTKANDIEWAYEPFETVSEALKAGKEYFGEKALVLVGEIGEDNKVTPIEEIKVSYSNAVEWGGIEHPTLGRVMTYYPKGSKPFDSYTAPFIDHEGDICHYRYDHDEGYWVDDTFVIGEYTGEKVIAL